MPNVAPSLRPSASALALVACLGCSHSAASDPAPPTNASSPSSSQAAAANAGAATPPLAGSSAASVDGGMPSSPSEAMHAAVDTSATDTAAAGVASAETEGGAAEAAAPSDDRGERHARRLPSPVFRGPASATCNGAVERPGKAPGFRATDLEGRALTAGSYRGRVVLVAFWATWCKPCMEELPELQRIARRYQKSGLSLLAVSTDDDADAVRATLDEHGLKVRAAIGGEASAKAYGERTLPFTALIDADGRLRGVYAYSEACMSAFERDVRSALEDRGAGRE